VMLQQAYTPSNTGLQSLVDASADYDLAPIGIGSMREQVDRLAEFGRNGDIYVVHAAEGETVIPMEVLDSNPKVKEMLFAQMRDMGLDPNEFVVGNELNSINPVTGMPEFFLGGIFRAVKKVVKKVFKIVKKIAPIVLPIAAAAFGVPFLPPAFFGAGTFGASFLGSGIGSLIGGASLGESLKAGLIGGGLTVLGGGLKASLPGGAGFSEGVSSAFYNPGAATFSQNVSSFGDIFTGDTTAKEFLGIPEAPPASAGGTGSSMSNVDFATAPSPALDPSGAAFDPQAFVGDLSVAPVNAPVTVSNIGPLGAPAAPVNAPVTTSDISFLGDSDVWAHPAAPVSATVPVASPVVSVGQRLDAMTPGSFRAGMGPDKVLGYDLGKFGDYLPTAPTYTAGDVLKQAGLTTQAAATMPPSQLKVLTARAAEIAGGATPGLTQRYGLAALGGAGILKATGAFDPPEESEEDRRKREALEQQQVALRGPNAPFARDPERYLIADLDPYRYQRGDSGPDERVDTRLSSVASRATQPVDFGRAPRYPDYMRNRFETPFQDNPPYAHYAADGGFIDGQPRYPRREMLVEGSGTERSDDIPAMLSDGEFVLNAQSVRGADPTGQGNRYRGAQNLYNMMRNFEMRG